jgi:hypothetical protein
VASESSPQVYLRSWNERLRGEDSRTVERQVRKNSVLSTDEVHKCVAKRSIVGNGLAWALVYIAEFMWAMRHRIIFVSLQDYNEVVCRAQPLRFETLASLGKINPAENHEPDL